MTNRRVDIGALRREQIVEAAAAIISEQGMQNLSLSAIEKRAKMSRGQLTYYFPTKEAILLAVFDRFLQLQYQRLGTPTEQANGHPEWWDWTQHLLERLVGQPPLTPEFHALQYSFIAQTGHRADFRQRLAKLYEEWRGHMAQGVREQTERNHAMRPVPPRAMASLIQALLHGLTLQLAADPAAFDREETLQLCLDMLGSYLWGGRDGPRSRTNVRNGVASQRRHMSNGKRSVKEKA